MSGRWIDCTPEEYHAASGEPRLSQSIAHRMIADSPLHARRAMDRSDSETSDSMDLGSVVHALLLGKGKGHVILVDKDGQPFENRRTKAAQTLAKAARSQGKIPVLQHEVQPMLRLAGLIRNRLWDDFKIELDGQSEQACHWTETTMHGEEVLCRGMLDHYRPSIATIYDLKIVKRAHPEACRRHLIDYGCDIQQASYIRAVESIYPALAGRVSFVFLFGEAGTGAVTPVQLRGEMAQIGAVKWQRAVDLWAQCIASGHWPAYTTEPIVFSEAKPWEIDEAGGLSSATEGE